MFKSPVKVFGTSSIQVFAFLELALFSRIIHLNDFSELFPEQCLFSDNKTFSDFAAFAKKSQTILRIFCGR